MGKYFQVKNSRFWILEVEGRDPWVFEEEEDATDKVCEILQEEGDIENATPDKYNLQQVEIGEKKYNIKPISWFKVVKAFARRKRT